MKDEGKVVLAKLDAPALRALHATCKEGRAAVQQHATRLTWGRSLADDPHLRAQGEVPQAWWWRLAAACNEGDRPLTHLTIRGLLPAERWSAESATGLADLSLPGLQELCLHVGPADAGPAQPLPLPLPLPRCPMLQVLRVAGISSASLAPALCAADCTSLRELVLSGIGCASGSDPSSALMPALSSLAHTLERIDFSSVPLGPQGLHSLASCVWPALRTLRLERVVPGRGMDGSGEDRPAELEAAAAALGQADMPSLEDFDFSLNDVPPAAIAALFAAPRWSGSPLRRLVLDCFAMSMDEGCAAALAAVQGWRLEELLLAVPGGVMSATVLAALAPAPWLASLRSLNVCQRGRHLAAGALVALNLPRLETLIVADCDLDDAGAADLARGRWPMLTALNASLNELGPGGAAALARGQWPLLQELDVTCNYGPWPGQPFYEAMGAGLAHAAWPALTKLNCKSPNGMAPADVAALGSLPWLGQLQELRLTFAHAQGCMAALAPLSLPSLRVLEDGSHCGDTDNWNGDVACQALCASSWASSLRSLELREMDIAQRGAAALAAARWPALEHLSLDLRDVDALVALLRGQNWHALRSLGYKCFSGSFSEAALHEHRAELDALASANLHAQCVMGRCGRGL